MLFVMFFFLLQITSYFHHFNYFVVCATTVEWYFKQLRQDETPVSIMYWVVSCLWYHTGSITLGAFLGIFNWFFRFFTSSIHATIYEMKPDSKFKVCWISFIDICWGCFKRYEINVHWSSYCEIAMRSCSFCVAGMENTKIYRDNILKRKDAWQIKRYVLTLFNFFACLGISALTVVITWGFLQ